MPPIGIPITSRAPPPDDTDTTFGSTAHPESSRGGPTSPIRFAITTNAFNLIGSPFSSSSSSSNHRDTYPTQAVVPITTDHSPTTAGTIHQRRLRRPSMLSLAQTPSFGSENSIGSNDDPTPVSAGTGPRDIQDPSSSKNGNPFTAHVTPFQPTPRWGPQGQVASYGTIRRVSSAPLPIEGLTTSTPPPSGDKGVGEDASSMEMDGSDAEIAKSPLRWMPSHLQSASKRKGKAREDTDLQSQSRPADLFNKPFTGRPLPAPLLATLISESSPLEHEMQSEARLQRLIMSHPSALPFTPRASRSSRGRFPEMVGGDDDDDYDEIGNIRRPPWERRRTWRGGSSDSDSDEMPDEPTVEPVNSAFAAGMDMDRPASSSSSSMWISTNVSESGKSTPAQVGGQPMAVSRSGSGSGSASGSGSGQQPLQPTPPSGGTQWPVSLRNPRMSFGAAGQGMVPSPGSGLGLPGAFGSLGMGGIGTPFGSPTVEKLELAVSPGTATMSSPGMMQYRDSSSFSASLRPGKRKAQVDDRFDPYKRPRGTSPSPSLTLGFPSLTSSPSYPISPSRNPSSIPIPNPSSPSHYPTLYTSGLSTSNPHPYHALPTRHHPYTRPMSSRSRAASPALSIGSTSGVLSTSLTNTPGGGGGSGRGSFAGLGGAFIPGQGGLQAANIAANLGVAPALGGLGLLSLAQGAGAEDGEGRRGSDGIESIREDSEEVDEDREDGSGMEED